MAGAEDRVRNALRALAATNRECQLSAQSRHKPIPLIAALDALDLFACAVSIAVGLIGRAMRLL
jgi:hypothetical protein